MKIRNMKGEKTLNILVKDVVNKTIFLADKKEPGGI